ncbi:Protein trichome birefringence-like [Parasponia andersonii]|uniref:Protein trichome birefringence-like n=1 Tax=Parasponia andersonii TaxID=3476 RepID=A0A2P5B7U4_PARAD|nr:Protein trichome birefringence-like [Parasponia andersonii]
MNWKKLSIWEQFQWPRRKVLSGFGLGVGVSLVVLALLSLSHFLTGPLVGPMFHGFQSVSMHTFGNSNTDSSSSSATSELRNSDDFVYKFEEGRFLDKTHLENAAEIHSNENLEGADGKGAVLKTTQLSNFTQEVKNGSFNAEPVVQEKGSPSGFNGRGHVLDDQKAYPGNTSKMLENVSFSGKGKEGMIIEETISKISSKNFSNGENEGRENDIAGNNVSYDGEVVNVTSQVQKMQSHSYEQCDIFDGKWVIDDSKPYYPGGSCPYIDKDFDCHLNRRPDDGFVKWKWQPNGCDIPSINAIDFLERLRGKKLVFVGDSLNRNMWESLVCILRHGVQNKKRVYEISGKREFKKKGFYAFRFEASLSYILDYNCSVDFVGSPFLVRESSFTGKNGTFETLRIDLMDRTTSMYHDADIIVFNTGHWWTHEKTSRGEDYYQEGNYVHPRLKVLEAYKRALKTWAKWVDKNIDCNRTQVFFRGYSVTHFRGGQWNSGGQCHKETEPIFNSTFLAKYPSKMRALEYVLQEMKTQVTYLNISRLTDYRKDGHPSIYRMEYKSIDEQIAAIHSQDCSHWCLPGVPDTWNELLYASLLKAK